jgi:transcriptional regulator with GAF, ATPase, and Fis domain
MAKHSKLNPKRNLVAVGMAPEKCERYEWLSSLFDGNSKPTVPQSLAVVYITETILYREWSISNPFPWSGKQGVTPRRVVLIWDCLPVDASALVDWKNYLLLTTSFEHSILICPQEVESLSDFKEWFQKQLNRWHSEVTKDEPTHLRLGDHIIIPSTAEHALVEAASLVSLSFGVMEETLERLEYWRRRYLEQVEHIRDPEFKIFHEYLAPLLRKPEKEETSDRKKQEERIEELDQKMEELEFTKIRPSSLPVVLLTGETGTGKTLIAKYLAGSSQIRRFTRISMPEFESSEHMFEYEVFGFRGGSYSDAPDCGDSGALLNYIAGVVFLDEIGDASKQTQRKLLAYLDDYKVRPRGIHDSIFCPTMVVAATNHNLDEDIATGNFRRDLYERFDVRIRVPSLNDRKPDFDFILDSVLQNPGINPEHWVKGIGEKAYAFLSGMDYTEGNFRRLENLLRFGIREASRAGRGKLLEDDLRKWQSTQSGT